MGVWHLWGFCLAPRAGLLSVCGFLSHSRTEQSKGPQGLENMAWPCRSVGHRLMAGLTKTEQTKLSRISAVTNDDFLTGRKDFHYPCPRQSQPRVNTVCWQR